MMSTTTHIAGIKLAKDREVPDGTEVKLVHPGPGNANRIRVHVRLPWQRLYTDLGLLPVVHNEHLVLPLKLAFLCHCKEDERVVEEVGEKLLQDGFLTWFDKKDLLPGDDWEVKIEAAIDDSDYVLVFLSPRSCSKDGFVQKEIRLAMERRERKPDGARYIVPLLVEPCTVPRAFEKIQYLELWQPGAYEKLKQALTQR